MKKLFSVVARRLFGDYEIYRILMASRNDVAHLPGDAGCEFACVDRRSIEASADELIREQAWYAGPEDQAFSLSINGQILAICFYWHGERYRTRNYWPLSKGEAKLVQIVTVPAHRGKGLARQLISQSSQRMFELGFQRLFARVWITNASSLRAFRSAGWKQVAVGLSIDPWRRNRLLTWFFGQRPSVRD